MVCGVKITLFTEWFVESHLCVVLEHFDIKLPDVTLRIFHQQILENFTHKQVDICAFFNLYM